MEQKYRLTEAFAEYKVRTPHSSEPLREFDEEYSEFLKYSKAKYVWCMS